MNSSYRASDGIIGHRQPSKLRRATWRILDRNFSTIFIFVTGLILLGIWLYANESTRPGRILPSGSEQTFSRYKRDEACAGQELVRNLIRDGGQVPQDDPFLVEHVKTHLLTPPSRLPYNLESKSNNTSQFGQNLAALALLKNMRNGFFIECGAWDGEYLSNSLLLEKDFAWTGLLIEANPGLAHSLRNKNRKAWTSSACLSVTPYPAVMNFFLDDGGINSLVNNSASMNKVFNLKGDKAVQVLCIPLYTYLLALKVEIVDYLSLDVEAADFAVLKTIPFDKVIFRVIEVEVQWVVEGKEAVKAFLESKGYILAIVMMPDYIFVHQSIHNPHAV